MNAAELQLQWGQMLRMITPDHEREGLRGTPARVARAWGKFFGGYELDPADVLKVFEDGAEQTDEMILVKNIRFYSHCEHHVVPFFGYAHIGYIPDGRIVGLSKLARLVDIYARRLQVQERLTSQVAGALWEHLAPAGVAVCIEARHLCMESRGVEQASTTMTTKLLGCMKDDAAAKQEFLLAIGERKAP